MPYEPDWADRSYHGMIVAMTVRKVTISLDPGLYDSISSDAERKEMNVSSWLAEAAAEKLRRQARDEYMAAYEAEFGEITPEQVAEAHRKTFVRRTGMRKSG